MQESKSYIRTGAHGVMRVGDGEVMLDSVMASYHQGASPETIQQQYPALRLEEVFGAIAWCLAHPEEVASYLERQARVWERARAAAHSSPVLRRLRELRQPPAAAAL